MRKIWTHTELSELFNLRYNEDKTLKELAGIYGVSVSAMARRMDRNPLDPEYRLARHKEYHLGWTKNGYCPSCTCLYTKEDLD